jgi:hypothetical protein
MEAGVTGDEHERRVVMAGHLGALVEANRALRRRQALAVVVPGSIGANEINSRIAANGDLRPLTEARLQGFRAIAAAEDFIGTAVDQAGRADRSFSTMTVLRGAAEALAQAFWYLDPGIDIDEREARAMGGLLEGLRSARTFANKGKLTFGEDVDRELNALRNEVDAYPNPKTRPNWEQLTRALADRTTIDPNLADAGYHALASAAHSQKDARDQIVVSWEEDGAPVLRTHAAKEFAYWYIANLYAATVTFIARLFGWSIQQWLQDALRHTDDLQQFVNEVRAERT